MGLIVSRRKIQSSIYDKIGFLGLVQLLWATMPHRLAFPLLLFYGIPVYSKLLKVSASLDELLEEHTRKYEHSRLFRKFRPRFGLVKHYLEEKYSEI